MNPALNPLRERELMLTRRQLFGRAVNGIGTAALAWLTARPAFGGKGRAGFPNFKPRAKRVIYLHQSGAPVEQVCSPIGLLYRIANSVSERHLGKLCRV